MLGYFPNPYPDELFYSICARFSDAMRYPTSDGALRELFGATGTGTLATLPTGLDQLVAHLPPLADYTAEEFIDAHTLFPYYAPFLPPEHASLLRETMQGKVRGNTHILAGIPSHRIPLPQWLRFCPACVEEDRRTFGECYWHRVHQVTGVEVCPRHRVFLQNSTIQRYNPSTHSQVVSSAEYAIQLTQPQVLDPSNAVHQALLQIACDTAWLLAQHGLSPGRDSLRQRYVSLLHAQGLASLRGITQRSQILERVRAYYPSELLEVLSSQLSEADQRSWLINLLTRSWWGQPPIRHLLVMQFLGYSAERFFACSVDRAPFGEGPWPCLNPACEFYRQPVIQQYQLREAYESGRPRGTFGCVCGFVYNRLGPEQSPEERFQWSSVKMPGPIWEAALREGWQDATLTLDRLAQQLGFTNETIRHYAAVLGLAFPRPRGHKSLSESTFSQTPKKTLLKSVEQLEAEREKHESAWLAGMREHPEWNRSTLARELPGVYNWLMRNHREWLEKQHQRQTPGKSKREPQISPQYWRQRDTQLAEALPAAAQRLRTAPGRPRRITKTLLAAEVHQSGLLSHQLDKLPLTSAVLETILDTPETYALRRLDWRVAQAQRAGSILIRTKLKDQLGRTLINNSPRLQQAIEAALGKGDQDIISKLAE